MTKIRDTKVRGWLHSAMRQLDLYLVTAHSEHLHKARVLMKKILATEKLMKQPDVKRCSCFKEWKIISSLAGEIRVSGIRNELMFHLPNVEWPLVQEKLVTKRMNALRKKYVKSRKLLDKGIDDIATATGRIKTKEVIKFLNKQLEKFVEYLNAPMPVNHWHSARIHFKRVLYLSSLLSKKQRSALKINVQLPIFDSLQEELGRWHDISDLRRYLDKRESSRSQKQQWMSVLDTELHRRERKILQLRKQPVISGLLSEFDET